MSAGSVTSSAGGGATGSALGSVTSTLQGTISKVANYGSTFLDKFFPPEKREQWKEWLTKFATERPYLASFLLSQIALNGPTLVLFACMTVSVVIFALLAGILVGLIGALLFIVGALGFALLILLPILFFTTTAAVFIWLWGMGAYFIVKWFNQKDIPGVHTDVKSGLANASGSSENAKSGGQQKPSQNVNGSHHRPNKDRSPPPKLDRKADGERTHGSTTGAQPRPQSQNRGDGKENQNPNQNRSQSQPVKRKSIDRSPAPSGRSTANGGTNGVGGATGSTSKGVGV